MWVYETHSVTFGRQRTEAGNNQASWHEMIPTLLLEIWVVLCDDCLRSLYLKHNTNC